VCIVVSRKFCYSYRFVEEIAQEEINHAQEEIAQEGIESITRKKKKSITQKIH
jgi:hypothetical protein